MPSLISAGTPALHTGTIECLLRNISQDLIEQSKETRLWNQTQLTALGVFESSGLEIEDIVSSEATANNEQPYVKYLTSTQEADTTEMLWETLQRQDGAFGPFTTFYLKLAMSLELELSGYSECVLMIFVDSIWSSILETLPSAVNAYCESGNLRFKIKDHYKIKSPGNRFVYRPLPGPDENRRHKNKKSSPLLSFGQTQAGENSLAYTAGELFAVLSYRLKYLGHSRHVHHDKAYMLRVGSDLTEVYLESTSLPDSYILAISNGITPKHTMEIKRSRAYNLLRSNDRINLAHAIREVLVMFIV